MTSQYPTSNLLKNRNKDVPVFAYMGDFNINIYGLDTILWAFSDYKNKYLESGSLWLIGEGKDKNELVALTKELNIEEYVHFKKLPEGKDKIHLLNQIDLFLRPSRSEFFPTTIIEAAAASVPSIVAAENMLSEHIKAYNAAISELPKEISDEEIKEMVNESKSIFKEDMYRAYFIMGAKWYREQLKNKI